jgi:2-polyprenyl-3-methyl-5-hydroxy-6-metoxy-1,4-benzoquinol methylase
MTTRLELEAESRSCALSFLRYKTHRRFFGLLRMEIDFGKTADDYGQYRAGFPDAFFDRLFSLGVILPNDRVLDLGTGTGTVARGLALRGCSVVGLDPSSSLMDEASRLDRAAGASVTYVKGGAEDTGQSNHAFEGYRGPVLALVRSRSRMFGSPSDTHARRQTCHRQF